MLIINGKEFQFVEGKTILETARENGIQIPTLCVHERLPSFGACRLCLVKVQGLNGYITACTTPVKDGMVITTDNLEIKKLRRSIFELILSEHPSHCMMCDQVDHCEKLHRGPIKSGRITGCRTCPNKEWCELLDVADELNFKSVRFPLFFKGIPLDRNDPFFDRDMNLCIHCGRCVRVCQDVEGKSILDFTKRGFDTVIGTSFGKPFLITDCKFCGSCIDVCPTGALSARGQKWYQEPENQISTTCMLCNKGCQFQVDVKWNRLVGLRPDPKYKTLFTGICVKGRFCLPVMFNNTERLEYPMIRVNYKLHPTNWDEATTRVAQIIETHSPSKIALYLTPFLTDEADYIFQKFAEQIGMKNIYRTPEDLKKIDENEIEVLYTTEGIPGLEKYKSLKKIIFQEVFPSDGFDLAEVVLPTVTFTEENGTITTQKGLMHVLKMIRPPDLALDDWKIITKIARELAFSGFNYLDILEINQEMERTGKVAQMRPVDEYYLKYRGTEIADKVPDFKILLEYRKDRDKPW